MSSKPIFVVDTNVFVQAYKNYYAFDIVPSFWRVIKQHAESGYLISIDRIKREINDYAEEDELKIWVNNEFANWFHSTDNESVFTAYRQIIDWSINNRQFTDAAKAEFASVADSWLIAFAKSFEYVLVTQEVLEPNIKRKIPIPNVCQEFGVQYINTFGMMRKLSVNL